MLDPMVHDVRSRMFGLAFWMVLPLIAVTTVGHAMTDYAHNVNRRPPGLSGTFIVTNRSCFGNVCQTAGTFVSDDRTLREPNLLGYFSWRVGERHHTAYQPDTGIIALPARWDPTADLLGAVGALLFLILWAVFLVSWAVRRSHARR
jgi:hypothetical protein